MKTCSHCKQDLPLDAFNKQTTGKHGRRAECRECVKRYDRTEHGLAVSMLANSREKAKERGYLPPTYSLDELKIWLVAQPHFPELYQRWVDTGYAKETRPSIDRIDDYVSYTLNNIQLLTWEQNIQRQYVMRMSGENNKQSEAVDMLDMDENFIERFHSVSEAARKFNGVPSNIIGAINRRTTRVKKADGTYRLKTATQAYGHKWRYSLLPNDNQEKKDE